MAIKVKNLTKQRLPLIVDGDNGGAEVVLMPNSVCVFAMEKPTKQMITLAEKRKLKITK